MRLRHFPTCVVCRVIFQNKRHRILLFSFVSSPHEDSCEIPISHITKIWNSQLLAWRVGEREKVPESDAQFQVVLYFNKQLVIDVGYQHFRTGTT